MFFSSIRTRIIASTVLAITVSFLVAFFLIAYQSYWMYRERLFTDSSIVLDGLSKSVNDTILNARWLAMDVISDEEIQRLLTGLDREPAYERYQSCYRIDDLLLRYSGARDIVYAMFIIGNDGRVCCSDPAIETFLAGQLDSGWYRKYRDSGAGAREYFTGPVDYPLLVNRVYQNMICYIHSIGDSRSPNVRLGTLVINLNRDAFTGIFDKLDSSHRSYVLQNASGDVVYGSGLRANTTGFDAPEAVINGTKIYGNREGFLFVKDDLECGWRLSELVSNATINQQLAQQMKSLVLIAVLSTVLTACVLMVIVLGLTRSIKTLRDAIVRVSAGDLRVSISVKSHDEIQDLSTAFNAMVVDMRDLIRRSVENEKEKQGYMMKALIMQINPHFINNTLNSVLVLARKGRDEDIIALVSAFTAMLQNTIYAEDDMTTVRDEIAYLRDYELIQKIRYGDVFSIEFLVNQDLLDRKIPRMVLQPLVENSLYHGLLPRETRGRIEVRISHEESGMRITISDDGVGMDAETLSRVLSQDSSAPDKRFRSVGVKNVNDRIRLLFAESTGLSVDSWPGEGTVISFRIPFLNDSDGKP
jgi:two-component system, sensor histidine kinase YesM